MSNWLYADRVPAAEFRGSMTLPRHLSLRRRQGELVLAQRPVLRPDEQVLSLEDHELSGTLRLPVEARTCRVVVEVEPASARRFGIHLREGREERTTVWVDPVARTVTLDRTGSGTVDLHPAFAAAHTAPLPTGDGPVRLEVVVDVASVEVFVAGGEAVLTDQVFPDPQSRGLSLVADGGTAVVRHLSVHT